MSLRKSDPLRLVPRRGENQSSISFLLIEVSRFFINLNNY